MNTPPEDKTILSSERFVAIKTGLIQGNEFAVTKAWERLLDQLQQEVQKITTKTSKASPIIDYNDLRYSSTFYLRCSEVRWNDNMMKLLLVRNLYILTMI